MLRKSFEVMSKFLELGVGHSAVNQWKTHGVGSILKAAVTAWRRAARRPPESRGKMSLTLETTTAEHQRFDAARDVPLLIPAWWASRIRWFSAARKSNGRSRGLKRLGRTRPRLPDLIFQSGRPIVATRCATSKRKYWYAIYSFVGEKTRGWTEPRVGEKPFNAFRAINWEE